MHSPVHFINQTVWTMAKRKQAPAASASSSWLQRKKNKSVNDRSASGKALPATAFDVVVGKLSIINKESYHYIYQVSLKAGQELYPEIGTFSHLFGLDDDKTLEVLKEGAGLVGIEQGRGQNPVCFKTQQWEQIANYIPGLFWTKYYGHSRDFIFGLGSKGEK
jgi:hypothetical protein